MFVFIFSWIRLSQKIIKWLNVYIEQCCKMWLKLNQLNEWLFGEEKWCKYLNFYGIFPRCRHRRRLKNLFIEMMKIKLLQCLKIRRFSYLNATYHVSNVCSSISHESWMKINRSVGRSDNHFKFRIILRHINKHCAI